jgi:Flp pilus assembly pilin Flp
MRTSLLSRWLSDESGQDIIEYALLCTFVGFGAVAGVNLLRLAMHDSYLAWDAAVQSDALVETPEPSGP